HRQRKELLLMKNAKAKAIDDAVRSTQLMEALAKRDREIALNLLKTDLSIIQISEATGMPVEDIKKLKEDQK
ncbi:MAG: hypothetical protein L0M03_08685, partial [Enterococcus sp.]|nr:hypothetical protein [Enterococcus sp.]